MAGALRRLRQLHDFGKSGTAPFQGGTTRLIYNSAWHAPVPATYAPADGLAVFPVRAVIQGDVLCTCRQLGERAGAADAELFRFSFQTLFMQHESEALYVAA